MLAALTFAFSVGAISSINPCGFALLPAYFARRLGVGADGNDGEVSTVGLALGAGGAATGGFVLIFGVIGGIIGLGAFWLAAALPWAGFVIGFVLALAGLFVLFGKHIGIRLPTAWSLETGNGLRGDFIFGLGYGTASLSCTLPIFLSVTGVAITGGILQSALSFVAFGLGMGTILTAIAVAAAYSQDGLASTFKRFLPHAHKFSGGILLLAGLYVIFYWGEILLGPEIPTTPGVVGFAEHVSAFLRNWIGGDRGQIITLVLFGVFVAAITWALWRRQVSKSENSNYSKKLEAE